MKISIIITSFNEPDHIRTTIKSLLPQLPKSSELIVVAPDNATLRKAKEFKEVKTLQDPGKGKSFALNLAFNKINSEIIIMTDGDVIIEKNAIRELLKPFQDPQVACVSSKPLPTNSRKTMFGFWAHLLCEQGAHLARLKRSKKDKYLECSAYLWAIRNKIKKFPLDMPEDTIIPLLFYKNGSKIKYAPKAVVRVHFPTTIKDFIEQKVRTAKGHQKVIQKYPKIPHMKSFTNEIKEGVSILSYPKSLREMNWLLILCFIRMYIWIKVGFDQLRGEEYKDGWKRINSTKKQSKMQG